MQISTYVREIDPEAHEQIEQLEKKLGEIRKKVVAAYLNSPEGKLVTKQNGSVYPNVAFQGTRMLVTTKEPVRRTSLAHMSDTTVNTLLTGKLLQDWEKKALLAERFGGVLGDPENVRIQRRVLVIEMEQEAGVWVPVSHCYSQEELATAVENLTWDDYVPGETEWVHADSQNGLRLREEWR